MVPQKDYPFDPINQLLTINLLINWDRPDDPTKIAKNNSYETSALLMNMAIDCRRTGPQVAAGSPTNDPQLSKR